MFLSRTVVALVTPPKVLCICYSSKHGGVPDRNGTEPSLFALKKLQKKMVVSHQQREQRGDSDSGVLPSPMLVGK